MILSNTDTIANKEIVQTLGLVKGTTVQTKHIGRDIMAGLKTLVGGEIESYTQMIMEARERAENRMIKEAEELRADAVVNIRYATSQVVQGASEVLAYGTAVKFQ